MIDRGMTGVFGQAGSGKTTLLKELLRPLTRVILWDSKYNEFDTVNFDTLEGMAGYLEERSRPGGFFKVSYRPKPWEYEAFLEIVTACGQRGDLTCVVEEARRLPPYRESPALDNLLNEGRHEGVEMIFATLRPFQLEPECRAQLTDVYSFYQTRDADIKALRDEMGDVALEIPRLAPKYEYLHWNKFTGETGVIKGRTKI